jgi:hypothetical protein
MDRPPRYLFRRFLAATDPGSLWIPAQVSWQGKSALMCALRMDRPLPLGAQGRVDRPLHL